MMFCKGCNKEHLDISWIYKDGWYCTKYHVPTDIEFVPERVKDERVEYFNSTVQPFRNGEVSKEYIEVHGSEGINATEDEIKKAKDVWGDLRGHKTRKRSK